MYVFPAQKIETWNKPGLPHKCKVSKLSGQAMDGQNVRFCKQLCKETELREGQNTGRSVWEDDKWENLNSVDGVDDVP